MAHVMQPAHIDFHPVPVTHSPSPLGFGFGLSATGFGCANNGHAQVSSPFQHLASAMNQAAAPSSGRTQKRRHEPEDEAENEGRHARDVTMGRSPTPPERLRRSVPKRLRILPEEGSSKGDKGKEKSQGQGGDDEVDVGVLLGKPPSKLSCAPSLISAVAATLPPSALLPILSSMLQAHPALKPLVISLVPRPTLDTAIQALNQSAKKLRDAYPFSNASTFSPPSSATSFGFGANHRPSMFGNNPMGFGFGRPSQGSEAMFGQQPHPHHSQGMRDDYILSRLRPHISEFISTCFTYLPYFSCTPDPSHSTSGTQASPPTTKEKTHPNEIFQFLSALTAHVLSQPPLAQTALAAQLLPRLVDEWRAWVDRVDAVVNHEGGMFSGEVARGWERALDEFAQSKGGGMEVMAEVRDRWVGSVGWLVGRMRMDH